MLTTQSNTTTCPFCALLCDDLRIQVQDNHINTITNGCYKAASGFTQTVDIQPRVKGQIVSQIEAIEIAVDLLSKARLPLYAGLGTDVAGIRAVLQLAKQTGGIVDHKDGNKQSARTLAIQNSGYLTTTLTEVRNRADFMLWIGDDIPAIFPRLWQRCVEREATLFANPAKQPTIVHFGSQSPTEANQSFNLNLVQLPEVINGLRALLAGQVLQTTQIAGIPLEEYQSLIAKMKAAQYGVIVWQTASLNMEQTDLTIHALYQLAKDLNQTTRFSALPLGGNEGGVSALQVTTWQTGFPLRIGFKQDHVHYDSWQFDTQRLLKQQEVDTLLWLSSFDTPQLPKDAKGLPTILLANTYPENLTYEPDVFIPIGTPGIHHTGQLFRVDGVVALPLQHLINQSTTTAETILSTLTEKILMKCS